MSQGRKSRVHSPAPLWERLRRAHSVRGGGGCLGGEHGGGKPTTGRAQGRSVRAEAQDDDTKKIREKIREAELRLAQFRAEIAHNRADRADAKIQKVTDYYYYFEIAKHLTTLDTAAILVFLAVVGSGEVSLPLWVALAFVVSLAAATASMLITGLREINTTSAYAPGTLSMAIAVCSFFGGLMYAIINAVLP